MSMKKYDMYIDGKWASPSTNKYFESVNPANEEAWCEIAEGGAEDVTKAVEAAHQAFHSKNWASLTQTERGHLLRKLGDLIADNVDELAIYETKDNGKLLREMKGQLQYMPKFFYYFAGLADKMEGSTIPIDKQEMFTYTQREPLGVIAAITPWNSPLYLTFLKLAPALAAGNTLVIKPSEYTSASLLEFMKLVEQAGFPSGVVNVVTGFGGSVGSALTSHPSVAKIAFTGGIQSARKIVKNSSENLAELSLELGGKSPNIVFGDANINNAVMGVIAGVFGATGQSCVAGSRLLIQEDIYEEFVSKLLERIENINIGDPLEEKTEMGPLANKNQLETVEKYVGIAREEGSRLLTGGQRPDDLAQGWYYKPTVFEHLNIKDRIVNEEIFGPVLSVISFKDEEEAIEKANSTNYGLAAGVWTQNLARAHRVSDQVTAGIVWVNTYRSISPMAPIGGSGFSGYGREGGIEALNDYTQVKTTWINTSDASMEDPFKMR